MNNRPPIIELVGPPGAGKSTLAELLLWRNGDMRAQTFPDFRKLQDDPFFARNTLALAPTFLRLGSNPKDKRLTRRDAALMTVLNGWHRELERLAVSYGMTIVLDEGAICLLSKLHGFGSESLRGEDAKIWWGKTYQRWAETLDLIIQLEASAATLLQRIRSRGRQYEIGKMTDEEALKYLARICVAQGQVLSALAAIPGGPQIIRYNTEDHTPDQIACLIR